MQEFFCKDRAGRFASRPAKNKNLKNVHIIWNILAPSTLVLSNCCLYHCFIQTSRMLAWWISANRITTTSPLSSISKRSALSPFFLLRCFVQMMQTKTYSTDSSSETSLICHAYCISKCTIFKSRNKDCTFPKSPHLNWEIGIVLFQGTTFKSRNEAYPF